LDVQSRVLPQGSTLSGASRHPNDSHGRWSANPSHDVLQDLMEGCHPWRRERVRFSRRLRTKPWPWLRLGLIWGICLVTVLTGARPPCGGPFCTVATLNRLPLMLVACTVICLTVLLVQRQRGSRSRRDVLEECG
jgi:hypothetical protein